VSTLDFDAHRDAWVAREELAERLIPQIGRLYRDYGVVTSVHGHRIINLSAIGVIEAHERARQLGHRELTLEQTDAVLKALLAIRPGPASVDVARLAQSLQDAGTDVDVEAHVRAAFADLVVDDVEGGTDVVLYGFGRIGRLLARILISHAGNGHGLRLRAIVVRRGAENDLVKRASLLSRDSVHGPFPGTVEVDEANDVIIANGTRIQVIYSSDPAATDYTAYGIHDAVVVDNTGRWRDEEGLSQHLQSPGVARVLLTAPGKTPIKNIVHGINDADITPEDRILSAASCTTP
jgi:glyceraldehyde 3-phosphate dehydrogenase